MAEEFQFSFSMKQIDALIKALEYCAINTGTYQDALATFRDPDLVNAAKSAHSALRRKGQKQSAQSAAPQLIREVGKESPLEELRQSYRALRSEHMDILSLAGPLLRATIAAQTAIRSELASRLNDSEREALRLIDQALGGIRYSDTQLDSKLWALQNEEQH